jgi:hypothetical protein
MDRHEIKQVILLALSAGLSSYIVLSGFALYFNSFILHLCALFFLIQMVQVAAMGLFCLFGFMDNKLFQRLACSMLRIK